MDAEVEMWGPPEFDRYTFIYHFANDNRSFDGMEHLASTQIIHGDNLGIPASSSGFSRIRRTSSFTSGM